MEADADLKSKIEALEGAEDVIGQVIDIAVECGYTLTKEDFAVLTEEDFQGAGNAELHLDDLDTVSGGAGKWELREILQYL